MPAAFFFVPVLPTAGVTPPPPPATGQYVGINALDGEGYASLEQPFLNILKQAGSNYSYVGCPWWTRLANGNDSGEEGYLPTVFDGDGYPTTLAVSGIPGGQKFTYVETWMNINLIADTPVPGCPNSGNALYPAAASAVTYRFQFLGKCTLNFTNATSLATSTPGVSVSGTQIISTNPWTSGLNTVTFSLNASTRLQILALPDSANYFKAATLVDASQATAFDAGEVFHPYWKAFMNGSAGGYGKGFSRLRVLQGYATNSQDINLMFAANVPSGATSATLATNGINNGSGPWTTWPFPSVTTPIVFSTGDVRTATFTFGSGNVTWVGGLSGACNTNTPSGARGCMAAAPLYVWATRPKPSNVTWSTFGLPFEVAIQAANELALDLWHTSPLTAMIVDGSFDNNLAALMFNGTGAQTSTNTPNSWNVAAQGGLSASQVLYHELCNEASGAWNGGAGYIQGANVLIMMSVFNGLYAANGNSIGYGSAEEYGVLNAGIANTFRATYGSAAFAARCKMGIMTQFATGNGVGFLKQAMNTPNAITLGLLSTPAYQNNIGVWGFAPYCPLSNSIAGMNSTDQAALFGLSAAAQITEIFSLAYTNVGASGHTYTTGFPSDGWVGDALGVANGAQGMINGIAGQPWATLPIATYEGGINADQVGGIPGSGYTLAQFSTLMTGVLRDARIALIYSDPAQSLSTGNVGYLKALANLGITVTHYNGVAPTTVAGAYGGWGILEDIMQVVGLESNPAVVPRYLGVIGSYVNLTVLTLSGNTLLLNGKALTIG